MLDVKQYEARLWRHARPSRAGAAQLAAVLRAEWEERRAVLGRVQQCIAINIKSGWSELGGDVSAAAGSRLAYNYNIFYIDVKFLKYNTYVS